MNVVDLHPEDLIDKLVAGNLSSEERGRLQTHLHACAECRFELDVRGDLADEAAAHAHPGAAPLAFPAARTELEPADVPTPSRRSQRPTVRRALLLPLLAAALVTGGALAAVVSEVVRSRQQARDVVVHEPAREGHGDEATARRSRPASTRSNGESSAPAASASVERATTPPSVEAPSPPPSPASAPASSRPSARVANPASRVARNTPASLSTAGAHADMAAVTPEALFGAANRARRYGDTAKALGIYRSLQERFPDSEEARLSRATLATLQLDQGDPGAALDGFDRYIAQGGSALTVEALVGRADALQKLGRADAEIGAWREVARRFPGTIHARRAAARIAVLEAR